MTRQGFVTRRHNSEVTAHICHSELLLFTFSSFISSHSLGIFPSGFRRIQQLHNSPIRRLDSAVQNYVSLLSYSCVGCPGVRVQAFLSPWECLCALICHLITHHITHEPPPQSPHTTQRFFCSPPSLKHVSLCLFGGRDRTGVKGWWQKEW